MAPRRCDGLLHHVPLYARASGGPYPGKLTFRGFAPRSWATGPLLVLILMTVFSISAYNVKTSMIVYFTQYYLGNISAPYVNLISIGSSVFGILSIPFLVKRFGKKRTALFGFGIAVVADGLNFLSTTTSGSLSCSACHSSGWRCRTGSRGPGLRRHRLGHWKDGRAPRGHHLLGVQLLRKIAQSSPVVSLASD